MPRSSRAGSPAHSPGLRSAPPRTGRRARSPRRAIRDRDRAATDRAGWPPRARSVMKCSPMAAPRFGWFASIAAITLSTVRPWNACTVKAQARSIWRSCGSPTFTASVRPSLGRNVTRPSLAAVTCSIWLLTRQSPRSLRVQRMRSPAQSSTPSARVDLGATAAPADLGGLPVHQAVLAAVEQHRAAPVVDADDAPLVVLLDAEPPVGAVEGDDIARRIVPRERCGSSPGARRHRCERARDEREVRCDVGRDGKRDRATLVRKGRRYARD